MLFWTFKFKYLHLGFSLFVCVCVHFCIGFIYYRVSNNQNYELKTFIVI